MMESNDHGHENDFSIMSQVCIYTVSSDIASVVYKQSLQTTKSIQPENANMFNNLGTHSINRDGFLFEIIQFSLSCFTPLLHSEDHGLFEFEITTSFEEILILFIASLEPLQQSKVSRAYRNPRLPTYKLIVPRLDSRICKKAWKPQNTKKPCTIISSTCYFHMKES